MRYGTGIWSFHNEDLHVHIYKEDFNVHISLELPQRGLACAYLQISNTAPMPVPHTHLQTVRICWLLPPMGGLCGRLWAANTRLPKGMGTLAVAATRVSGAHGKFISSTLVRGQRLRPCFDDDDMSESNPAGKKPKTPVFPCSWQVKSLKHLDRGPQTYSTLHLQCSPTLEQHGSRSWAAPAVHSPTLFPFVGPRHMFGRRHPTLRRNNLDESLV